MPPISAEALVDRLVSGKPISAVLLVGKDSYLREACRERGSAVLRDRERCEHCRSDRARVEHRARQVNAPRHLVQRQPCESVRDRREQWIAGRVRDPP